MADGSLILELDDEMVARLRAAAEAAGESPDGFVRRVLAEAIEVAYWAPALESLADYDRTGVAEDAGPALERFKANVRAKLSAKRACKA